MLKPGLTEKNTPQPDFIRIFKGPKSNANLNKIIIKTDQENEKGTRIEIVNRNSISIKKSGSKLSLNATDSETT